MITVLVACVYRFEQRLLHPGANTSDILTQYVSAIRALHVLDPAGVILEHVCAPVRQYLRYITVLYEHVLRYILGHHLSYILCSLLSLF